MFRVETQGLASLSVGNAFISPTVYSAESGEHLVRERVSKISDLRQLSPYTPSHSRMLRYRSAHSLACELCHRKRLNPPGIENSRDVTIAS